jgi:hypothetical protein
MQSHRFARPAEVLNWNKPTLPLPQPAVTRAMESFLMPEADAAPEAGVADRSDRAVCPRESERMGGNIQGFFSDREIIELAAVATAYEFFTRFVDSLRIPTTPLPG